MRLRWCSWASSPVALVVAALVMLSGCDQQDEAGPPFVPNLVNQQIQEEATGEKLTEEQKGQIAEVLLAIFGTPDDPDSPFPGASKSILENAGFDPVKLELAAGDAKGTKDGKRVGLYRLHCAHCHGITGDGAGPTAAILNPYPRDYRNGTYKFKSTWGSEPPTSADLKRTLIEGVNGTSMKSYRLLPDHELEALVEYVKYLSVRGQTEIALNYWMLDGGLPGGETFLEQGAAVVSGLPLARDDEGNPEDPSDDELILATIMYKWEQADLHVLKPATDPVDSKDEEAMKASVERGRKLFYSKAAACYTCHGPSAQGDGQTSDWSDWFAWRKAVDQKPEEIEKTVAEYRKLGALPPRNIIPRNLRLGTFRGGRRPIDIYRKIATGIRGTPMPGLLSKETASDEPEEGSLGPKDVWDLVHYVKSLQYEPLSRPAKPEMMPDVTIEEDH